ncbi:F510_1955 family glycosylhydrolase [Glutamicibacter sp. PS]|uniref:F510_1955 family glycosylhydrolase n=1 Tax=Glutamicibacter sp. PS TaxID=3075634 RepID=UPI00284103A3|nr:exo-alpha-sialidase [Glutamicibacter sp. PS]MDR4531955.1 exo-alpha-sialidase [Glutamicibacter sp. PS]
MPRNVLPLTALAVLLSATLSACSTTDPAAQTPAESSSSPSTSTASEPSAPARADTFPQTHIHGISVRPDQSQVLLATHHGIFDVTDGQVTKLGPTNDYMGFTASGTEGTFYASGHPGEGSDLPNPMGLLRSDDSGRTWTTLSREGQSDFHALTLSQGGLIGFDGQLLLSTDGKSWDKSQTQFAPAVLAGHPEGKVVLGTTEAGIQRSEDNGKTWQPVESGPVVQYVSFATPNDAAGIAPDGRVYISADAGLTWKESGLVSEPMQQMNYASNAKGENVLWVATARALISSTDNGASFSDYFVY